MSYFSGTPSTLPDQPVRTIDPKVERLAHTVIDGLIRRLAAEPATPAASLLENMADQLREAAALRRLGVVQRTPNSETAAVPRQVRSQLNSEELPLQDSDA